MTHSLWRRPRKLYQLIISRLNGGDIQTESYRAGILELVRKGIGGFIVFGGEIEGVKSFIDELQSLAEIPLFIASDIERGVGQQIKGCTLFPSQMAVSAAINKFNPEDVKVLRDAVRAVAVEAIDVGINMPLIPVLDINSNPDNPIICTRAFSDNPEEVSWFGAEYIKVLEESGLISCAKHFPGHGDTSVDSHMSLPAINKSYNELMMADIVPLIEAINTGVRSIMVGHLSIPAIDTVPASFSEKIITDLLRKKLGFEGLVMTDALNMSALAGFDNIPARCMAAGVDILLHPLNPDLTVNDLEDAIGSGMITSNQIDTAIERILKVKSGLRDIKREEVDYARHNHLSECITEMSVTLVKGDKRYFLMPPPLNPLPRGEGRYEGSPVIPPPLTGGGEGEGEQRVSSNANVQLIVAGEDKFYEPSVWEGWANGNERDRNVPPIVNLNLNGQAHNANMDRRGFPTPPGWSSHAATIFAIFSETSGWKGRSGIDDREKDRLMELVKSAGRSVVISFGSPYVLRYFEDADVLIAAYGNNEKTQRAVMSCLTGKSDFKGRLPVRIFV